MVAPEDAGQAVLAGRVFDLEIADTPEERRRGLSHRAHLPADAGMLFVFDAELALSFWMKDTLLPLDVLFLDKVRRIVDIQTMTPQPGAADAELKVYPSRQPAMYALEINAGTAEKLGLTIGMAVELR